MSFLSEIFEQKAGGTFVGNLIRSAASELSGGILGQGKNKLNADGTVGNGANGSWLSDALATLGYVTKGTPQGQQIIQETGAIYAQQTWRNNWLWIVIIAVMGGLLFFVAKK